VHGSDYPSSYPWQVKGYPYVPPAIPTIPPKFPTKETGGFIVYGSILCDANNSTYSDAFARGEFTFLYFCPMCNIFFPQVFQIPPNIPLWNCSKPGNTVVSQAEFTGVIGSQTVSCTGKCCQRYYGTLGYGQDMLKNHQLWAQQAQVGLCGQFLEANYCSEILTLAQYCTNRFLTPGTRAWLHPCIDVTVAYLRTCKTYVSLGVSNLGKGIENAEPAAYVKSQTPEQQFTLYGLIWINSDKICNSYAYFYPSTAMLPPSATSPTPPAGSAVLGLHASVSFSVFCFLYCLRV